MSEPRLHRIRAEQPAEGGAAERWRTKSVFLLVALGLWIGRLIASIPGGLAIVGAGLTVAGLVVGLLAVKALERQRLARASAEELRRDAEWIRTGI